MPATSSDHIPAELWLAIWLQLDLADRVAASRVCTRWRAIALESQDLWREVYIHSPLSIENCPVHQNTPCMLLPLPILLERSGTSTISLFLSERERGHVHHLLGILIPHLHRVARLKVSHSFLEELLSVVIRSVPVWPALRRLETTCLRAVAEGERNWSCPHARKQPTFANIQLPALEHALFSADHDLTASNLRCLPSSLTRLQLEINTVVCLIPALEQCPNLLWLRVGFWECHSDYNDPDYESDEHRVKAHDLARRIPEVVIAVTDEEAEERAIEVFPGLPTRQSLHLIHRGTDEKTLPRRLFDGLQGMVSITVTVALADSDIPDTLCIKILVEDVHGMDRKVTLLEERDQPAALLAALWNLLEGRIERVNIDTELHQQVTGRQTIKPLLSSP